MTLDYFPILLHISNIAYIIGTIFSDNLKLRLTLFFAGFLELLYGIFKDSNGPIWEIIIWSSLWTIINGYYSFKISRERLGITFTKEERRVKDLAFSFMDNSQFKKIMKIAKYDKFPPKITLIEINSNIDKLIMILNGSATVQKDEVEIATLKPGNFAGEISLLTDKVTNANVISDTNLEIIYWNKNELLKLFKNNPEIKITFHSVFNMDFIDKLVKI